MAPSALSLKTKTETALETGCRALGRSSLLIEGREVPFEHFMKGKSGKSRFREEAEALEGPEGFMTELALFLEEFFSESPTVTVYTSGSTGRPKPFGAEKRRMIASARMTAGFLGLEAGATNLLAMPLRYIAGKMVVVRSLACGLDLIVRKPSSNPYLTENGEADPRALDLVAVTPMQAIGILKNPATADAFLASRKIIIGGGAVDKELLAELQRGTGDIYSSYGMTETLSHIALRKLNGESAAEGYRPLSGVALSISPKGTLVIAAPAVAEGALVTNDIARIREDGTFTILGRLDNVINTGAIKVQTEVVEAKLKVVIKKPFAISSRPSHTFGDEVVLVVEGTMEDLDLEAIKNAVDRYERPHAIVFADAIPLTKTQKADRPAIRALAARPDAWDWRLS